MEIIKFITYALAIIWLLVPIKQYRTRFFYFFLILGLLDPITITLYKFLSFRSLELYLVGAVLLIYPALFDVMKWKRIVLISIFAFVSILTVIFSPTNVTMVHLAIHSILLIQFLKVLMKYFSENRSLIWFHIILIVYEVSLLLKFFIFMTESEIGPVYFYATTSLQIIIGLFFLFVNEKNSPAISV
jgi:hypothetical protein